METLRQGRISHTSWLGATALAQYKNGIDIDENTRANMDIFLKTMGFRFVLESIKHVAETSAGSTVTLDMLWTNKGVAPFYYNWPLEVALADDNGNLLSFTRQAMKNINIKNWLPGKQSVNVSFPITETLPSGTYTLVVAIIDPITDKPGIQLAIEGKRADGWYRLNEISVGSF